MYDKHRPLLEEKVAKASSLTSHLQAQQQGGVFLDSLTGAQRLCLEKYSRNKEYFFFLFIQTINPTKIF